MSYLLNLIYLLLLAALSPLLVYRVVWRGKYRRGWREKLLGLVEARTGDQPCVWLHAVSVGEVNLLGALLRELETRRPDWECVISTTTDTGFELAKKRYPRTRVIYAPLDFSWAVRRAMRRIRPTLLVLAELELWPNLIAEAKRWGTPVAIINGRLSERSFRGYRRLGWFIRRVLRRVDVVAVQSEEYAQRFRTLGANPAAVHVTGSIKYDGAQIDRGNLKTLELRRLAGIATEDIVLLAGSTQTPEEELALATYRALSPQWPKLRLILVPRHPERFDEVAALLDRSEIPWQRRSRLTGGDRATSDATVCVLLVDTVGELGAWWGIATIAFVGGSLGQRGGQNMIEPAAYGAAVCFGPNTWNFRDIVAALLAHDAARIVRNGRELTDFVRHCLDDPRAAEAMGQRAQRFVLSQAGATGRTATLLEALVGKNAHSPVIRDAA